VTLAFVQRLPKVPGQFGNKEKLRLGNRAAAEGARAGHNAGGEPEDRP